MLHEFYSNSKKRTQQTDEYFLLVKGVIRARFEIDRSGNMKKVAAYYGKNNQEPLFGNQAVCIHQITKN